MIKKIIIFVAITLVVFCCKTSDNPIIPVEITDVVEMEPYFIQFRNGSIARFKREQRESEKPVTRAVLREYQNKLDNERKRFMTDFAGHIQYGNIIIKEDYRYITNTLVIHTSYKTMKTIKRMEYIKQVDRIDTIVEQDDEVVITHADDVWVMEDTTGLPVKGNGIVAAVIDNGFNYYHPALGGGMGEDFQVIGGYDFADNDPDPFLGFKDHGTKVAGILLKIAPETQLLLYRVKNEENVIAALETITDPDNDPSTDSIAADVLNISQMHSYGSSNNVLSEAFDDAVDNGLVCIAAAGNEGEFGNFTIGSPASSIKTIAVGNSRHKISEIDFVYESSSRGPDLSNFLIKPDLCAPGYTLIAPYTKLNQYTEPFYTSATGTSFSAPVVAGAAALLLQLHPDWKPLQIKAALTESSTSLFKEGYTTYGADSVFAQGAGRLDIKKAVEIKSLILPSHLSLGVCDLSLPVWSTSEELTMTNTGTSTITYTFTWESYNLVNGITIDIQPPEITIDPGKTENILFTLSVNNAIVPTPESEPFAYEGWLLAESPVETLRVPFAYMHSAVLHVTFDKAPRGIFIHNSNDYFLQMGDVNDFYFDCDSFTVSLPVDTYDIMTGFFNSGPYVVVEDIIVNGYTEVSIDIEQADKEISVILKDKNNNQIMKEDCHTVLLKQKDLGIYFYAENVYTTNFSKDFANIITSSMSEDYVLEWSAHYVDEEKTYYFFNDSVEGISDNLVSQNDPDDFYYFQQTFYIDPGIEHILVANYISSEKLLDKSQCDRCGPFGNAFSLSWDVNKFILTFPFTRDVYLMPSSTGTNVFKYTYSDIYEVTDPENLSPDLSMLAEKRLYRTPLLSASAPVVLNVFLPPTLNNKWQPKLFSISGSEFLEAVSPHYFSGMFIIFPIDKKIKLLNSIGGGTWNVFPTIAGDFLYYNNVGFEVFSEIGKIGEMITYNYTINGLISPDQYDDGCVPVGDFNLPSLGTYSVSAAIDYMLNDYPGECTFTATFNTQAADASPPYIRTLKLLNDNVITPVFNGEQTNQIIIEAYDYGKDYLETGNPYYDDDTCIDWELGAYEYVDSISLDYRIENGIWKPLNLTSNGHFYVSSFPGSAEECYVDLRITLADASGNTQVQEIKPAFYYIPSIVYPEVVGTNLPDGITNISPAVNIVVTFSMQMNTSTVEQALSITPAVSGTFTWKKNNTQMWFTPDELLENISKYTYIISTTAADVAGNHLQADFVSTFTIAPEDIIPPIVLSTNLPDSPGTLSVLANIVINFSAPMDIQSTEQAFAISPAVTGTVTWKNGNRQMRFNPDDNLSPDTQYTIAVSDSAVCATGEHLVQTYIEVFQTD